MGVVTLKKQVRTVSLTSTGWKAIIPDLHQWLGLPLSTLHKVGLRLWTIPQIDPSGFLTAGTEDMHIAVKFGSVYRGHITLNFIRYSYNFHGVLIQLDKTAEGLYLKSPDYASSTMTVSIIVAAEFDNSFIPSV